MNVLGCDLSTRALDLVLLDENSEAARWTHLPLPKTSSRADLARAVTDAAPQPAWLEHHGVYLIALEQPMSTQRNAIAALNVVLGALVASLPADVPCWTLAPWEWKHGIGLPGNTPTSKGSELLRSWAVEHGGESDWSTDAYVALSVAYTAREANAAAIATLLEAL